MWARNIDGILTVSEDLAEKIKTLCVPKARILANGNNITLGKSMDLERTGNDDRFWFYSEDEKYALQLNMLLSQNSYEVVLVERKVYWFGLIKEKMINLVSLSFLDTGFVVVKDASEEKDPDGRKDPEDPV